jgi:hypothetical protein
MESRPRHARYVRRANRPALREGRGQAALRVAAVNPVCKRGGCSIIGLLQHMETISTLQQSCHNLGAVDPRSPKCAASWRKGDSGAETS